MRERRTAVVYARVSTEDQAERGYSLEAQVEDCLMRAAELGFEREQVTVVTDEASGAVLDRPGLNRLRDMLEGHPVPDCVIMYDPDRFARKLAHQLLLTEEIVKRKIALEFVNFKWNNTPEGRMFYQLRGMFAEFEREKIRERTIRGRLAKVKNHGKLSCNPRLFGYFFDTAEDVLRPDPDAADTVRRIFASAAAGLSAAAIARQLESEGVPGPRGRRWYGSTVSRILRNRSYLGTYMAYKVDYHRGYRRERPPEEQVPLSLEPLIDGEEFEAAQRTLSGGRKQGRPVRRERLLSGLVVCGCGRPLALSGDGIASYYRCSGGRKTIDSTRGRQSGETFSCRNRRYWNADVIDELVWMRIKSYLLQVCAGADDSALTACLQSRSGTGGTGGQAPEEASGLEMSRLCVRQRRLEERSRKLLDLYLSDGISREEYDRKSAELTAGLHGIGAQLERIRMRRVDPSAHFGTALQEEASLNAALLLNGNIAEALDSAPFPAKRELARLLLSRAVMSFGDAEGGQSCRRLALEYRVPEPGRFWQKRNDAQGHGGL